MSRDQACGKVIQESKTIITVRDESPTVSWSPAKAGYDADVMKYHSQIDWLID